MPGSPRTVGGLEDLEACEGITNEHLFTFMAQSSTFQSIDDHGDRLPHDHTIDIGDQLRFSAAKRVAKGCCLLSHWAGAWLYSTIKPWCPQPPFGPCEASESTCNLGPLQGSSVICSAAGGEAL